MRMKNKITIKNSFSGKGVFPPKFAFTLLIPLRNIFLSPKKLIERLELKDDFSVLEIGPGPGYFSTKIAQFLTNGKLVLADIQQEMLDYSKKRISKKNITNVEYYLCDGYKFEFPDEHFDRIFMVTVLGEVENQKEYLQEIKRILKRNGILSISELAGDPDKLTINKVSKLAFDSGFKVHKQFGNEKNYTLNLVKQDI